MEKCISIDWLQLYVQVPYKEYDEVKTPYIIEKQAYQTTHFKKVYIIYNKHREEIATLASDPHSGILTQDGGLLKIHNKYLYQSELYKFTIDLLRDLQLVFKSISRLDIALDFLQFETNKSIASPEKFIQQFASRRYKKYSKNGKNYNYKLNGKGDKYGLPLFEYLKFGSETSDTCYYLYNKSKELEDNPMKGWITDNWTANGWDGKQTVWRLEFSVKKTKKILVDSDMVKYDLADIELLQPENIKGMFKCLFSDYWNFQKLSSVTGEAMGIKFQKKITSVISFFKDMVCNYVRINLSEKKESNRSSKIFTKALMTLNQELRGHDFNLAVFSHNLLSYFVTNRSIEPWFEKKFPQFQLADSRKFTKHLDIFSQKRN